MNTTVKSYLKIFSIIFLSILIIRTFAKCKGSLKSQFKTGVETSSEILTLIYLLNI